MMKKVVGIIMVLTLLLSVGCTKGGDAGEVAKGFNADLAAGKAYKSVHLYVEDNETLEITRDKAGNVKVAYKYDDVVEEFYRMGEEMSYFYEGEQMDDIYSDDELSEVIETALEDVTMFPADSMEGFDLDIDSNVVESEEKNAYAIIGDYDDGTSYAFFYGKDGTFFELIDEVDMIRTDLDDSIVVELPQ